MSITKREQHMPRPLDGLWGRDFFDAFLNDRLRGLMGGDGPFERIFDNGGRLMRTEEFIDGDDIVVRAELPGMDPEKDVEIMVEDGVLRLSASREERSEEERPDGYRSEFHYGTFVRSFGLPDGVSAEDVRATYKDGILEIRVPNPPTPAAKPPEKVAVSRG
jgi:HSP20 family protein